MGKLARVLSFVRVLRGSVKASDVAADTGAGFNVTAEHFAPAGDDSQPLAGDYAALMPGSGNGREIAVGYLDPAAEQLAGPGEKRIYARNAAGAEVVSVWLKADGTAVVSNGVGTVELQQDGTVDINGVTIDTSGNIITPGVVSAAAVIANGKNLVNHTHAVTTAPGTTGPNQ